MPRTPASASELLKLERSEASDTFELESPTAGPSSGRHRIQYPADFEAMAISSSAMDDLDTQPLLRPRLLHDHPPEPVPSSATPIFSLLDLKSGASTPVQHHDNGWSSSPRLTYDTESTLQTDDLVEPVEEGSRFTESLLRLFGGKGGKRRMLGLDLNACATKRSVFDDAVLARYYWPKEDYEGFGRFDVKARWTVGEEKVCLISCSMSPHYTQCAHGIG